MSISLGARETIISPGHRLLHEQFSQVDTLTASLPGPAHNRTRYDSLLVHYLAAELSNGMGGIPVKRLLLDTSRRRMALDTGDGGLLFDLHPLAGHIRSLATLPPLADSVPVPRHARLQTAESPRDERLLFLNLTGSGAPGKPRRIVIELLTNQWNALVLDVRHTIMAALWPRKAGGRRLLPGRMYSPPAAPERIGREQPLTLDRWKEVLRTVPPPQRLDVLIGQVGWCSPINGRWVLGSAMDHGSEAALQDAHQRYLELARLPPPNPVLLLSGKSGSEQPYPVPLPGQPAKHVSSLLEAFDALARNRPEATAETRPVDATHSTSLPADLVERLHRRCRHLQKRLRGLSAELDEAGPQAELLRKQAGLLLSQLDAVRKGMTTIELDDFAGGTLQVELDPQLSPVENANKLFTQARKRERAAERLPELIRRVNQAHEDAIEMADRVRKGLADTAELEAATRSVSKPGNPQQPLRSQKLPYRRYFTTGGLEARVGRNRRTNDELTFRHSSPDDIWLHARDAAGSHVVLRWTHRNQNPPGRDIQEAAVLAALHSKSRTSGSVAVDWTRRRYVRKPRKAPPGLVVMDRAKTVFVRPDPEVERRLKTRQDDGDDT